jgi:hypothetical protein
MVAIYVLIRLLATSMIRPQGRLGFCNPAIKGGTAAGLGLMTACGKATQWPSNA